MAGTKDSHIYKKMLFTIEDIKTLLILRQEKHKLLRVYLTVSKIKRTSLPNCRKNKKIFITKVRCKGNQNHAFRSFSSKNTNKIIIAYISLTKI